MTHPPLSIVIPAYNNEAYLAQTVESILSQDYSDFELIIADHASADATFEVAQSFTDARVCVARCEAGGGAGRNWNFVSGLAQGTYLKLVCGDDLLLPGALTAQMNALTSEPGATLVAGRRRIVDAEGETVIAARGLDGLKGFVSAGEALRATVRSGGNIFGEPGGVTMHRKAFLRGGGWDAREKYLIDVSGCVSALRNGGFIALPEVHAAFRLSATQWSARLVKQQYSQTQGFFERLQFEFPQEISRADVALGSAKAYALAHARRATYRVLRSRMGGDDIQRTT